MSRRQSCFDELEGKGWPIVAVDVGNQVRRFGKQAEIQFNIAVEALKAMKYRAVGFGPDDLRLSAGEVAAAVAGADQKESIFTSANVNVFGLTPKLQLVEENGIKIGITAVIGDTFQKQVNNAEIEFKPAADSLTAVVPKLEGCDIKILLANATVEESIELGKKFPVFDFVVTAEGGDEPPNRPQAIEGTTGKLIEVGHKGMYAVVIGIYQQEKKARYQRVALDSRFQNSPEMKQLMVNYQEQLKSLGWDGLSLRATAHPRTQSGVPDAGKFVGAQACKKCHESAFDVWSESKHAHATETLTKLDPPRQFDAECVSCHVTGWNPHEYFPFKTGFESVEKTPRMLGSSCENCHGPGGAHVAAEVGKNLKLREEQRAVMIADDQVCGKCHDLDNSPNFKFDEYWKKIEH